MKTREVVEAFREAMRKAGMTGELEVHADQSISFAWVGEPQKGDKKITVTIATLTQETKS